ncbi:serine/threonine/tyrosine interacting protein [Phyllostomus discolor]|uniref:Serine/threonine/tyrosine interacting protein n=1 Tax=Phyllostomus discolor TaxID=89673 RepID=A0A834BMD6_9CHIR|nr:serine/threonine/tyrosine interacting protein [Phyllostomus discolor]
MEDLKLEFPSLPQCKEDAEEWTYPMRREMQLPILQKHGITHIICIRQNIEANFIKPNFQQLFSAAFVIAYIMETFGMKYRDAFAYVQERRFCINPNAGFVHQLQEYEAIYLAKLTIQMMSPLQIERSLSVHSGTTGSLKRTHEEDDDFGSMQVATAQNG